MSVCRAWIDEVGSPEAERRPTAASSRPPGTASPGCRRWPAANWAKSSTEAFDNGPGGLEPEVLHLLHQACRLGCAGARRDRRSCRSCAHPPAAFLSVAHAPPRPPSARIGWHPRRIRRSGRCPSSRPPPRGCRSRFAPAAGGTGRCRAATARSGRKGRCSPASTGVSSRSGPTRGRRRPVAQQGPAESAVVDGGRPQRRHVAVQERPRPAPARRASRPSRPAHVPAHRRVQDAAEVGDRPRWSGLGPVLGRQEMRHGRPGVEGLDEPAHRDPGGTGPPERLLVLGQPELEAPAWRPSRRCRPSSARPGKRPGARRRRAAPCRGRWRTRRRRSPCPPPGCGARRRGAATRTTRGRPRRADRWTAAARRGARRASTGDPSPGSGGRRPRRPSATSAWTPRSMAAIDRPSSDEPERVDPVEEAELDAAVAQDLVERGEDHLAHARLHLPEQRARVLEEHLGRQFQSEPGAEAGAGGIAALVAEDEVVHAPEDRRLERGGVDAVAEQPLAVVEVVDGTEAVGRSSAGRRP